MNDYLAYNICTHNDTMISKGLQRIFKAKHKKNNWSFNILSISIKYHTIYNTKLTKKHGQL